MVIGTQNNDRDDAQRGLTELQVQLLQIKLPMEIWYFNFQPILEVFP